MDHLLPVRPCGVPCENVTLCHLGCTGDLSTQSDQGLEPAAINLGDEISSSDPESSFTAIGADKPVAGKSLTVPPPSLLTVSTS